MIAGDKQTVIEDRVDSAVYDYCAIPLIFRLDISKMIKNKIPLLERHCSANSSTTRTATTRDPPLVYTEKDQKR